MGNPCIKHQAINDAAKAILEKHEELLKWHNHMSEELKVYIDARHMAPFWEVKSIVFTLIKDI